MSLPLNDDPEDPDLVAMRRLSQGDDRALNGLMARWKSRLIAYLFRFTGDGTAASDLALPGKGSVPAFVLGAGLLDLAVRHRSQLGPQSPPLAEQASHVAAGIRGRSRFVR